MQEYTDIMTFMLRNRIIFVGQRIDDAVRRADCTDPTALTLALLQLPAECTNWAVGVPAKWQPSEAAVLSAAGRDADRGADAGTRSD